MALRDLAGLDDDPTRLPGDLVFEIADAKRARANGTASPEQVALPKHPAVQEFQNQLGARVAPLIDAAQKQLAKQLAPGVRKAAARMLPTVRQAVEPAIRDANQQVRPLARRAYRHSLEHPEIFATRDRPMVRRLRRAEAIRSPVRRRHEIERIRCDYFSRQRGRACRPAQNHRRRRSGTRTTTRVGSSLDDPHLRAERLAAAVRSRLDPATFSFRRRRADRAIESLRRECMEALLLLQHVALAIAEDPRLVGRDERFLPLAGGTG